MEFSPPEFLLFESVDNPFSGIIQKLFEHGQCLYRLIEVRSEESVTSQDVLLTRLPALQFDGQTLTGFSTICRAIATRVGLDGCTVKESNEVDMIVSFVEVEMDRLCAAVQRADRIHQGSSSSEEEEGDGVVDEKARSQRSLKHEFDFNLASILDARFKANNSKFVVGKSVTWADYVLVNFLRVLVGSTGATILDQYPDLAYYFHRNHAL